MKKIKYSILIIIIIVGISLIYSNIKLNQVYKSIQISQNLEYSEYEYNYMMLDSFFETHFMHSGYPITNLNAKDIENEDLPAENDVLSESMGLLLQKYLKDQDKINFDKTLENIQNHFLKKNNLLAWKMPIAAIYNQDMNVKENTVNASVDDLRVIKALYIASEKFSDESYKTKALKIGEALKVNCTKKTKILSFDSSDSPEAIWTYYDFESLYYLSKYDKDWKKILVKSILEVQNHRIKSKPFFYIESKTENYKSIENLMIVMHFAEIGIIDNESIAFIKDEIKKGAYYGEYNYNGEALNNIESPAIYGIIAQLAKRINDKELYDLACKKLTELAEFQNENYYGGYIDINSKRGYSFDQLMAMLGY